MAYPKKQYVLGVTEGHRTRYYYGEKLGALIKAHVKVGQEFFYSVQITDKWFLAKRTATERYATQRA